MTRRKSRRKSNEDIAAQLSCKSCEQILSSESHEKSRTRNASILQQWGLVPSPPQETAGQKIKLRRVVETGMGVPTPPTRFRI